MDDPLISGGGCGADQALSEATETLERSSSLLDRINAQREREDRSAEEQAFSTGNLNTDLEMNRNGLQDPNYSPIPSDATFGAGGGGGGGSLNPFGSGSLVSGFSGLSGMSMSLPQMGYNGEQDQSSESLLSEQVGSLSREYSMTAYFKMFVIDIYSVFKSMPLPAQICTVVFLFWILWKLS
jgi:hypothetical protein